MPSSWSCDPSSFFAGDAPVLAGASGGRHSKKLIASGAPAGADIDEGADDQGGFLAVLGGGVLAAAPGDPGGPEGAQGGGVAAGLGGEVAAESERVRPAAQGLKVLVWVAAEGPGSADQAAVVGERAGVGVQVAGGDPHGDRADGL